MSTDCCPPTPTTATAPTAAHSASATRQSAWPLVTVALGFVMAMLDVTVVNVALSHIQRSLSIQLAGLVWVVDGYTLTFAALLLVGGALANRFGARTVYMAGLALFIAASLLCGVAPSGNALIGARLLQGVGAALFMPSSLSLLSQAYPDNAVRIKVLGLWSAIVSVAAAMGPMVGGVLVAWLGWRSIFWLNVPIGIVGLLLTRGCIAPSPRHAQALNPASHALGVTGLAALAFALIEGAPLGWSSAPIVAAMSLATVAIAAFVARERRDATPVVPRALFHDSRFPAANAIGFLINLGAFGQLFLFSLFLQQARGTDAWHTGVDLLPLMAVFTVGNLLSSRITARWGARWPMLWGLLGSAILSLLLAACGAQLPYGWFALGAALANFGVGIAVPAMTATVMHVAGQAHANIAAASLNANRQIGALIGVAAMGAVLHTIPSWPQALPITFGIIGLAYACAVMLVNRYIREHA